MSGTDAPDAARGGRRWGFSAGMFARCVVFGFTKTRRRKGSMAKEIFMDRLDKISLKSGGGVLSPRGKSSGCEMRDKLDPKPTPKAAPKKGKR